MVCLFNHPGRVGCKHAQESLKDETESILPLRWAEWSRRLLFANKELDPRNRFRDHSCQRLRSIRELRLREFPYAVQDFGARAKEPHLVIPARLSRQPIRNLAVRSAELNGDRAVRVFLGRDAVQIGTWLSFRLATIALGRRSLPRAGLPLASSEASPSCLPPHPKHQRSRRSARIVELPSRYNRWAGHLSR